MNKKHLLLVLLLLGCNKYNLRYENPRDISSICLMQWLQKDDIYMNHYEFLDKYNLTTKRYTKVMNIDSCLSRYEISLDGKRLIYEITSLPVKYWLSSEYYSYKMGMTEEDFSFYMNKLLSKTEIRVYETSTNKTYIVKSYDDTLPKYLQWCFVDEAILLAKPIFSISDKEKMDSIRLWRYDCKLHKLEYWKDISVGYSFKGLSITVIDSSRIAILDIEELNKNQTIKKVVLINLNDITAIKAYLINENIVSGLIKNIKSKNDYLVFLSKENEKKKVCFLNINDGTIIKYDTEVCDPYTFSPDGTKIAYIKKGDRTVGKIKIIENPLVTNKQQ